MSQSEQINNSSGKPAGCAGTHRMGDPRLEAAAADGGARKYRAEKQRKGQEGGLELGAAGRRSSAPYGQSQKRRRRDTMAR